MRSREKSSVRSRAAQGVRQGRTVARLDDRRYLDSSGLGLLERSFREWADDAARPDVRLSRRRILLIFLLIRYTGAKLSEVLALDPFRDIDYHKQSVFFRNADGGAGQNAREVFISEALSRELRAMLADPEFRETVKDSFGVDPGFVRLKFYERAQACGFSRQMGGPEMIRKARAVELMQGNMPLPAVQMLLGHSTPNLTSSYVSFSEDDIRQVMKHFIEKESSRKTSARNTFFGKVTTLKRGDIQTLVELSTIEGYRIRTVITNDSVGRLGLKDGEMITAEVKAPSVMVQKAKEEPESSAENIFKGTVERVTTGKVNMECIIRISEGTTLCSVITTESGGRLRLAKGDTVWALFNCFAVVLNAD